MTYLLVIGVQIMVGLFWLGLLLVLNIFESIAQGLYAE